MRNLFLWEVKKNVKKSAVIGISVTAVVFLILFAAVYNMLVDFVKGLNNMDWEAGGEYGEDIGTPEMPDIDMDNQYMITKEELVLRIAQAEEAVKSLEKEYRTNKGVYSQLYSEKSLLEELKYALENGYYDKDVRFLGYNYATTDLSGEGFVTLYASLIMLIALVYGVIYGANLYCGEYKSGTIKLVMTRPVKKNTLTGAKLLSMYTVLAAVFFVPVLIGYAYGAIAFDSISATEVIYSFNASGAGVTTVGALTFGTLFTSFINILVVATLSYTLATVTRNSAVGIIVALAVVLGIGNFFSTIGITAFTLSYSMNFMNFFGVASVVRNGNFFISLAVTLARRKIISSFSEYDRRRRGYILSYGRVGIFSVQIGINQILSFAYSSFYAGVLYAYL